MKVTGNRCETTVITWEGAEKNSGNKQKVKHIVLFCVKQHKEVQKFKKTHTHL